MNTSILMVLYTATNLNGFICVCNYNHATACKRFFSILLTKMNIDPKHDSLYPQNGNELLLSHLFSLWLIDYNTS